MADISRITLPNGQTYDIKDSVARSAIAQGISFHIATNASNTPAGVTWDDDGTIITGTLVASADTTGFYLVPAKNTSGKDIYSEYVAVDNGGYSWERLGDTDFTIEELIGLIDVELTLTKDSVLGADTTFTAQSSSVTFTGGTNDTFVKSYPGSAQKLATTSIKGVGTDTTFNAVNANTSVTATNTVFGTDTTASKVTTTSKTATNLVLGTATTASKATAGTAVTLAKPASSATSVSRIALSTGNTSILETATVNGETLVISSASVDNSKSITGINGSQSITPYTFTNVTVPVVTSNDTVTFDAVSSATDVTVPVVTSNNAVTATNTTTKSVTAATSAANATVVATGKVAATDANGDSVLIGLGTATTASAVTGIGTGTAAAQTITAGTNDLVNAVVNATAKLVEHSGVHIVTPGGGGSGA